MDIFRMNKQILKLSPKRSGGCFIRDIIDNENLQNTMKGYDKIETESIKITKPKRGDWKITTTKKNDILCFITTVNQWTAVRGALEILSKKGFVITVVTTNTSIVIDTSIKRIIISEQEKLSSARFFLSVLKNPFWHLKRLRRLKKEKTPRRFHNVSLGVTVRIRDILENENPGIVLLSNDHWWMHRVFMAHCHLADIPTVYVQHASVSTKFPRLSFSYACLDGKAAADIYMQCMNNHPSNTMLLEDPEIHFTGVQKNYLFEKKPSKKNGADERQKITIGFATNSIDDVPFILDMAFQLIQSGYRLFMRHHPKQPESDKSMISEFCSNTGTILSNPEIEGQSEFFKKIDILIAGDSSIALEGALAGLKTGYLRTTDRIKDDYYGFNEKGVTFRVKNIQDIENLVKSDWEPKKEGLSYYSGTYGTEWFGREAEVLALTLESIVKNHDKICKEQ